MTTAGARHAVALVVDLAVLLVLVWMVAGVAQAREAAVWHGVMTYAQRTAATAGRLAIWAERHYWEAVQP